MHMAGSAENSGEIFAAPSSRCSWKQSVVCPQQWCPCEDLQCWKVPEHPATAAFLMGLFLLEGEEKVIVAVCNGRKLSWGRKESQKLSCGRLSPSAQDPVAVLTLLHCAVAPTL